MAEEHKAVEPPRADVARMLVEIERLRNASRRHHVFAAAAQLAAVAACMCLIAIMVALASWVIL